MRSGWSFNERDWRWLPGVEQNFEKADRATLYRTLKTLKKIGKPLLVGHEIALCQERYEQQKKHTIGLYQLKRSIKPNRP